MNYLLAIAIIPVIVLGKYIYNKDINKEPMSLLRKIFVFGMLSCVPVVIMELVLGQFFDTENGNLNFITILINVFISVALIEEIFKWLVVRKYGYKSREFDEIYDIIVYSVFSSLGFACIENIGYVLQNGFVTGIFRALLSIPGHTCFGIIMGYYLSKAKVNSINNNFFLHKITIFLSIFMPTLLHAMYDSLLIIKGDIYLLIFFIFDIIMVICCFKTVSRISKIQQNIIHKEIKDTNSCPICGKKVGNFKYCTSCGYKIER